MSANAAPGTIVVTRNDHGTIFVEIDGELVADSACIRRVRGFHNKRTGEWLPAPDFTPRKVEAQPVLVLCYLLGTHTEIDPSTPVRVAF